MIDPARPVAPPRRRRGSKILVIVLVSLLVLLVAADRIGVAIAENIAADKLQSSQELRNKPDVDIEGIPFLTQLASREFDEVALTASDVPVGLGSASITIAKVRVVLHDLTVTDGFSDFRAASGDGTFTLGYRQLSDALGVDFSYGGDGKIRASKEISIFGQTIKPTITAEPRVVNGVLSFAPLAASGLGSLGSLADAAAEILGSSLPLQGIPFRVKLEQVSVTRDGLQIGVHGDDLSYNS